MIDQDYPAFVREYGRLSAALERFKQTPEEQAKKADVYFHVLKRSTLREVTAKADTWLARESKMPKPAEWAGIVASGPVVDVPELTAAESRDWLAAERDRWERPACACWACVDAGVSSLPLRFVPDLDSAGRDCHVRIGGRILASGHWAHGRELAGYWLSREAFWSRYDDMFPRNTRRGKHGPEFAAECAEPERVIGRHAQGFERLATITTESRET